MTTVQLSRAQQLLHEFTEAMAAATVRARTLMAAFTRALQKNANTPAVVAGLEGRFYVRAGFDPAYADECDMQALVRYILCAGYSDLADEDMELAFMTVANRSLVASAAIRGWVQHHRTEEPIVLAWFRFVNDQVLEVSRA